VSTGRSPALSYHAQHHVVRLELTRADALKSQTPNSDFIQRATAKLEAVKAQGKIEFYDIYEDRFQSVWTALRNAESQPESTMISFVLAGGAPRIKGLTITDAGEQKPGILISTTVPIDVTSIPVEWIRATIFNFAKQKNMMATVFMPHLQSALLRIAAGEVLDKVHIAFRDDIPQTQADGKAFTVIANKTRHEVCVFVYDLPGLQSDPALDRLAGVVGKAIEKMKDSGSGEILVLKNEMANIIRSAMVGPERIGFGMPVAVLAAMPPFSAKAIKKFLSFDVAEDKMSATVSKFDPKVYSDSAFKMTREFLAQQLLLSDLQGDLSDELYAQLQEAVSKRENLDGKVAVNGREAAAGAEPYLHFNYKEAPKPAETDAIINIRESQQRAIVQAGQFVAEVRFATPAKIGMNVIGQPILPPAGPNLEVGVGEGISQKEPGKFYAEYGGVPTYEEGKLGLVKSHVHEGDVNLKSGNIYFEGPLEIKGSVDVGSVVRVKGPLKVYGSITGGIVISKEPIEVVESIVTGPQGKIICSTQIKADFIENSNIECDGSVVVTRSLVSSDVVAGDYVQALAPDGVIGGGTIMCRNLVAAANIGFAKGARTKFIVGVDHKVVRRIKIREQRLANLNAALERYKKEFRELSQKKDAQLTSKHKQLKETLKEKMANVRPLIEQVALQVESVKASMTYNEDALIAATNVFASNCQVEVGGQGVVMEADTMACGISARKRRDSHLCTYDEIKSEIEKKLGGSSTEPAPAAEEKKAS